MIGATFQKIAGTGTTLGDIKINETFAELADTVTTLNEFGGASGAYAYLTATTASEFGLEEGWYDADEIMNWDGESKLEVKNNIALYEGEALMVQVSDSTAALVFAGLVPDAAVELECYGGQKTFLSNCTPVNRTLSDITVNADFAELADTLTMLNEFGGSAGAYAYLTSETAAEFSLEGGWYDADEIMNWDGESEIKVQDIALPAGQGFMMQVSSNGAGIIIPAAL